MSITDSDADAMHLVVPAVGIIGAFAALWVGSALLFRQAAWEQPPASAGPEG